MRQKNGFMAACAALTLGAAALSSFGLAAPMALLCDEMPLAKCQYLNLCTSDGTNCKSFRIKNTSADASGSRIAYTVVWDGGNSEDSSLTPGQAVRKECYITSVQVHEMDPQSGSKVEFCDI